MPTLKKRKVTTISAAPQELAPMQRRQAMNTYAPATRLRKHALSACNSILIHDAFLFNDKLDWECTSNCKVVEKRSLYRIQVLCRKRRTDKSGQRRYSEGYNTIYDAENSAFEFRYSLENKSCKANLDKYKTNLILSLHGTTPSPPHQHHK